MFLLYPMDTKPTKAELLVALTHAYEQGDLQYLELVSNMVFGYKSELKRRITKEGCKEVS
mgnify:CR=1 FL=1